MRAVLQRVKRAKVTVGGEVTGEIAGGWLVLLGVAPADTQKEIDWLADKVANLRAFDDADGKMNLSVQDVRGAFHNRHIRCYTAFYSAPNGDIYRWDVSQTSVPTAMNTREYLGNHHDPPVVAVAPLRPGKVRPRAELPEDQ